MMPSCRLFGGEYTEINVLSGEVGSLLADIVSADAKLLRGNHSNFVSVKVEEEVFLRVHRPVATRFSAVWKRGLSNPKCGIVTVTFPPDPPAAPLAVRSAPSSGNAPAKSPSIPPLSPPALAAPLVSQSDARSGQRTAPNSGNAPATPGLIPPPPPPPSKKEALKFIIQWMEQGGADPKGKNAVPYPKGYRAGLETLLALASMLEISELMTRVSGDLGIIPLPRPRRCPTCKRVEHPGKECQTCWECNDVGHRRANCPKAYQAFLEREARREQKAEHERLRLEGQERAESRRKKWQEKQDRRGKQQREAGIRTGEVAVGADGKTINRWVRD
ncbi:hypothetical protein HO173_002762 [Letharia columbiana]|uniref:CCHC-type domain-containing protein n=1 Tax=Letharia columbiana TaxID=112416 RepID=A0A8H6L7R8_9LECA|nr:uncharacterized protein HO173_002762 [Letharia columbiana]KAF6238890.1 hypothetical protein HO173_002762 [Letharia columbiana]